MRFRRPALLAAVLLVVAGPALAQRTDEVVLWNGNTITGEVKSLQQGKLKFKTDHAGTIYIEWEFISSITSSSFFEVENQRGEFFYGMLSPGPGERQLVIVGPARTVVLDMRRIVAIMPIKKTFWARVDGSVSAGFSFTKSSDITQLNFGSTAKYRAEKFMTDLRFDANLTRKGDREEEDSQRADLTFIYRRFRRDRFFTEWNAAAQRNDELGIDLRLIAGWAMGRSVVRTNHALLSLIAGRAVNQEFRTGDEPSAVTLGLPRSVTYDLFFYSTPKTDLKTSLTIFVGVSDWGRNRAEQNLAFRREFIKDLFWEISTYASYDSRPPESANSSADYGVVSSLGDSF